MPASGDAKPRIFWIDRKTNKTLIYVVLLVNAPNYRLTHQFNLGKDFFELLKAASSRINAPVAAPQQPQPNIDPDDETEPVNK